MENSLMKIPNLGNNELRFLLDTRTYIDFWFESDKSEKYIHGQHIIERVPLVFCLSKNKKLIKIKSRIMTFFNQFKDSVDLQKIDSYGVPKNNYNTFLLFQELNEKGCERFIEEKTQDLILRLEFKKKDDAKDIINEESEFRSGIDLSNFINSNKLEINIKVKYFVLRQSVLSYIFQKEGKSELYLFLESFFSRINSDINENTNFDSYIDSWASRLLRSSCSDDFERSVRRGV